MKFIHPVCSIWRSIFLAFVVSAVGPTHATASLTAESAALSAQKNNPDLAAARNLIAEADARTRTAGRLANPEIEGELAGGQDLEGRISIGITQRFPLTARLRLERELSAIEVELARLEVRERERQIAVAARSAIYELAAVRESLALARQQTRAAEEFAKSLGEAMDQGFGSKLDGQQASLAASTLRITEDIFLAEELLAVGHLNRLLGLPADSPISLAETLELPKSAPTSRPVGVRPDLQLAELAIQAGATDLSLAKAARWDDIGVGLFVEGERFRDDPEGVEPEALLGIKFSVPLPFWQDGSGKVDEKQAVQNRKTQQLEALRLSMQNEILTAHRVMTLLHRAAARIDDTLVPAARDHVAETEAAYRRAELDIQSIFRSRERLAEIEAAALDARKKYFLSYSDWLGTLGLPSSP